MIDGRYPFRTVARAITMVFLVAPPLALGAQASPPPPPTQPRAPVVAIPDQSLRGRVTGRVVDGATGQALQGALISIVGTTLVARSDLDGRYTIVAVPFGRYAVVAKRIGYQPKQFDNVAVATTEATIVNFTVGTAAVELQSVVVQADIGDRTASQASLLSAQQRAASASDGLSAEMIKRTPDANAGEAATRVSGVSIVEGKFLVARGLSERYSTTLLNGAEVPSPEPTRKIVPLDVFPASLLESIVVTKSATPDKPGDFSGGAVEIRTKEFPDNTILQIGFSQGYNSQATFRALPFPGKTGTDFFGIDGGRRVAPPLPRDSALFNPFAIERFAEGIRNDWAPRIARALPNLGFSATFGGQRPSDDLALGYVLSLTYSAGSDHQQDRFFQFYADPASEPIRGFRYQDYRSQTDWGGVANFSLRLGSYSKVSLKNLYTRNAEELYSTNEGFNIDSNGDVRQYQYQYVERDLLQSQLTGEHFLPALASSRLEWKATVSRSSRDEPDNRQLSYLRGGGSADYQLSTNSDVWIRTLDDQQSAAQVDWSVPFRFLWSPISLKVGALARAKKRAFDATFIVFNPKSSLEIPDGLLTLPPELLFTPENIGSYLIPTFPGALAQPYDADDRLQAGYGMLDITMASRVRVVAGARLENWQVDLFDGGRERFAVEDTSRPPPTSRRNRDLLLSANATVTVSDQLQVRFAAFQSVSRPDTRELSLDEYSDIAGSCSTIGNSSLQRTKVLNADARVEWYPRPGEVLSISGFYKDFQQPIIRTVENRNGCTYSFRNAVSAENFGAEFDLRKDLTFLPRALSRLSVGTNLTLVRTSVIISPQFGVYEAGLDLEGQSPYVANGSLSYRSAGGAFNASLLFNVFGDRIVRYGFQSAGGANATQGPNIVERGRGTLDAKLQQAFGSRLTVTLSGRNLTNVPIRFRQTVASGDVNTGFARPGYTLQLGASIAR